MNRDSTPKPSTTPPTGLASATFDRSDPMSIFDYSRFLIGQSLRSLFGDEAVARFRKGKGGLGQMVEELFFNYDINSDGDADFKDARLELKCTPLLRSRADGAYRIKERLVCSMIDYFEVATTSFEDSHLMAKCQLMLLLFYLHVGGDAIYDYEFLFRVLWKLPEKDIVQIRNDYNAIADKVRRGEAHLLSEGDTLYLGACRKGRKGDAPQSQPFSEVKANRRAFSLKPAYMRYILSHVANSDTKSFTNYVAAKPRQVELVTATELARSSFEDIITRRFQPYIGKNYAEICSMLGIEPYQAKAKYADICGLIISNGASKRIATAEEFEKSGITMKTVRLQPNGMPKEAMSFRNIDYQEVYDCDEWTDSEAYELFTTRFLFAVFRAQPGGSIILHDSRTGGDVAEQAYVLDKVMFWTMPAADLSVAQEYWADIRKNVLANNIRLDAFWSIADRRLFHVRPKARKKEQFAENPNGGTCEKYCYWMNADYVGRIIENNHQNV